MDDHAVSLAHHLWLTRDESVRVLGLFCTPTEASLRLARPPYPILGGWVDLEAFVRDYDVDAVVLAVPWHADDCLRMRSEEDTSELQSLLRISYAVLCLKKKNKIINIYNL